MRTETVSTDIAAPADRVWELVGDFGGLDSWMAGVDACDLAGDVRTVHTMGMQIREQLRAKDDDARTISYSIIEGAPCESHTATISVAPAGDGASQVTWEVAVEPDEAAELFRDVYAGALKGLKASVEG